MFGKHEWVPAEGTIVEVRVEPGHKDPYAAPKVYVVDLRPSIGAPYRAEVQFRYQDYPRTHQPDPGEVTGFRVDAKSKKVEFDKSDPRNDIDARSIASQERLRQRTAAMSAPSSLGWPGLAGIQIGAAAAAPDAIKWIVPTQCPNCGATVEQAVAEHEDSPRCAFCEHPLPVQPPNSQPGGLGVLQALQALGAHAATQSPVGTAARILEVGHPVQATLLAANALPGMKNAAGLDVTALVLSVTPADGTPAYQTQTGQHVPDEAQHLLVPGAVLPGKCLPDQASSPVVIDWEAALAAAPPIDGS